MNAWASLPNAAHIDAVLADLKSRPRAWAKAWRQLSDSELEESEAVAARRAEERVAARAIAQASSRAEVLGELESAVRAVDMTDKLCITSNIAAQVVAIDAMRALVAWDDCAYMLNLEVTSLRRLVDCYGVGLPQAALLLPAVIAMSTPA